MGCCRMRFGTKNTTSYYRSVDIRRLRRAGALNPGKVSLWSWSRNGEQTGSIQVHAEENQVRLVYNHRRDDEPWKFENYPVAIDRTPCNYGGSRVWFRCPAKGCGRRVAILYGGEIFACRHCYKLAYESQREAPHDRALRCTQAIRVKLGGSPSLAEAFPEKPKGMHWRTYNKLCVKAGEAQDRCWPPWILKLVVGRRQTGTNVR